MKSKKEKSKVGIYAEAIETLQGVAFIGGIGAGILGLPFAVAQVGLPLGIPYIILVGLLMMGVNLLIGEIIIRTKKNLQLAGLAKKYLGKTGETLMVVLTYALLFSVLLIYIVGEGEALSVIFGGESSHWSVLFFLFGSALVLMGMKMIKRIDIVLLFLLTLVLTVIIGNGFFHLEPESLNYTNWKNIFLPYGVLMFAFHSSTSIPEAYDVVEKRKGLLRRAIIASTIFNIVIYIFFAIATVGVMGQDTSAIATIGLGEKIGRHILIFGNVFAIIAMGMSFLNVASSLRDSMRWDFQFSHATSSMLACVLPFLVFAAGLREFIGLIDIVGGVIISIELLLLLLIYWRVKHINRPRPDYMIHHATWLFMLLIVAFSLGTVYSVVKLF